MKKAEKYNGIFPAFYACYGKDGEIDTARVEEWTRYLIAKGVTGVYVGGSSGECIYQSPAEREAVLEHVIKAADGKLTVIAHVACNNTADSRRLAAHAESVGADAIAAIPPIYFRLPDHAVAEYWNDISAAAPHTDFIIYNIPQLAGVALSPACLTEMLKNPLVIGVKNSSVPTQDIRTFKDIGGEDFVVFNGPDEQLVAGLAIGATGGIGGTYGAMPELYLKIKECFDRGDMKRAAVLQSRANNIITVMCTAKGNLYAVLKEVIRLREGIDLGGVRKPLPALADSDRSIAQQAVRMVREAVAE